MNSLTPICVTILHIEKIQIYFVKTRNFIYKKTNRTFIIRDIKIARH